MENFKCEKCGCEEFVLDDLDEPVCAKCGSSELLGFTEMLDKQIDSELDAALDTLIKKVESVYVQNPIESKPKKLQQFHVFSFNEERLRHNNYNLTLTPLEAERNEELISLADNECLRAIRRITNHPFNEETLKDLTAARSVLIKQTNSESNKKKIAHINNEIRELLFIKEFVSVQLPNKHKHPKLCKNGFTINGIKYKRLMCGAAHARTNRAMFCAEYIYDDLDKILRCGIKEIEIILAKWNAYYALSSTATYRVTQPKVLIIKDYETTITKDVDWVTENKPEDEVNRISKDLGYNIWDGMGLISPEMAKTWSEELGVDYIGSSFIIRSIFVKGLLVPFDFKKFADEISHKYIVKDLYGNEKDIRDVDVVLTQSQFKLWSFYSSFEQYEEEYAKTGCCWGVTRMAPEKEKTSMTTNYQFVQVLNLKDNDIEELCKPTIDFFKGVSKDDYRMMELYLLGKTAKEENPALLWQRIQDPFLKCLMLDNSIMNDRYINGIITKSIQKRMKEAMAGSLFVNGSFQFAICDPYAFCEWLYGMPIVGLLKEYEHYSNFWNKRGVKQCVAARSPMTWRAELNKLNLVENDQTKEWYKYLTGGIVYNIYGYDRDLHAGMDFDGDTIATTDNPVYLRCLYGGVPTLYQPKKAQKTLLTKDIVDELYKVDMFGFDTQVGYYTNIGTSYYALTAKFPKGSPEHEEILKRLKLICKQQNLTIDAVKGLELTPLPSYWTKYSPIKDDDDEETRVFKEFNNKLVVEDNTRPYFMRYVYPHYNKRYTAFVSDYNTYSQIKWGCDTKDIPEDIKKTEDYEKFIHYYNKDNPLIDTDSVMNKVCHYLERELKPIKRVNKDCDINYLYSVYSRNGANIDENQLSQMKEIYTRYCDFKKNKMLQNSPYSTYDQFYKVLRNTALEKISSSIGELANLAVYICYKENTISENKSFCWDVFGAGIFENMLNNKKDNGFVCVNIPTPCDVGEIEYLGQKYTWLPIELTEDGIASMERPFDYSTIVDEDVFAGINDDLDEDNV